ncbi:MAG: choice-of-anchor Q domain-containing protein [Anaerolineae bacterium]
MHTRPRSRILVRFGLVLLALAAVLAAGRPSTASATPACPSGTTLYVNASVSGGVGDGSSWPNAYTTLSAALTTATTCSNVTQIWVAQGTYKPAGPNGDRNATFALKNNLAIYGGFTSGQSNLTDRNTNPATNNTVLSGDLNGNDGANFANNGENSYHVLTGSGTASSAILDGFTVSGGNANGSFSAAEGGGLYNSGGSPTLTNVTFSGNSASYGGGMYNLSGNPTLTNATFSGNSGYLAGGGLYNESGSPTLTNVTFSGNSSAQGGGMASDSGSPTIRNSILWGDTGGEISGSVTVSYSIVQGGYPGTGNLNQDPMFVAPVPSPAPSSGSNLRLQYASPAINAGNNSVTNPSLPATDLDGNPRIQGGTVDMGAYESTCPAGTGILRFVNGGVSTSGNGQSWGTAYQTLTEALTAAQSATVCVEIWVAQGTYKPTSGADRSATFQLKNNLAIYGGFTAGQSNLTDRNATPATNNTVLSGDIGTANDTSDNSYHVVTGSGTNNTAILDGFTVTGGNANYGSSCPGGCGGGMYNEVGSPTLTNVTFSGNRSGDYGGGMYNYSSSPTLTNVTFSGNSATAQYAYGGGMANSLSSPTLTNVTFSGNSASYSGGGMYNSSSSSPTLTNVTFSGNSATNNGGGMVNGNGSNPTLTNVTFSGNSSTYGGGMVNGGSSPTIRNSILWGDSASSSGPEIYGGSATVAYSIVQGSGGSGTSWWNNNLVTDGGNNLDQDPKFATPVTLPPPANTSGNLRLQANSPAINAGNNNVTSPSLPATDLDGNPRILGSVVDMGAYEFLCPPGTPATLYVNAAVAGGTGTGDSWANASPTLTFALQRALACSAPPLVTQIWVAQGTYKPAGPNGDRNATFALKNNLAIYGGFTSGQTSLTDRNANPATNNTVLSGDLNGDDRPNFANNAENSYHVVTSSGTASSAILDGFTVTGGNANGSFSAADGGGMLNDSSSSPTLTNVSFSGNFAYELGGGMVNSGGSPTLTNVTFSGNSTSLYGGGMSNGGNSTPILTNVTFSGNSASQGGGMFNDGSSPILTNVTFSGNSADYGGGMFNYNLSSATIRNSILWGDSAPNGREIYNYNGSASVSYSIVQGGYAGTGNLNKDPLFVTAVPSPAPSTGGDLRLGLTSPAINAGNNSVSNPSLPATDLDGNPRIVYGIVDMGAYEAQVAVTKFSVSAPSSATQGSAFSVTVTAQDPNGATVSAYRGTVHFTSSDVSAGLPTDYTFSAGDNGVHTFTLGVTLNTLGSQTVTATDTANTNITGSASVNVVPPPTTVSSITRVGSTPTNVSSVSWTVTFASAVSGLTASNFALAVTGLGGTPTIGTVTPTGGAPATTWSVTASTGTGDGSLGLNLTSNTNLTPSVSTTLPYVGDVYTIDRTGPTVTINQAAGQVDPTNSSPIHFTVVFSEPVLGFGNTSVTLTGTAGATTAVVTQIAPNDGTTYDVAVSGMTTNGTVTASIAANKATDLAGNGNTASTSTDNMVTYDTTPPTMTINQASSQVDPTNSSPIHFTVVFSEPVLGFGNTSVTLTGTAGATTAVVTQIAPNDGTTYDVAVSGMTTNGTVTASIAANKATDLAGNGNTASTSTDNTVTYDTTPPTTTITGKPSNPSNNASPTFTFSATDTGGSGVASVQCSLDNAPFTACTSATSQSYSNLSNGSHTFTVRAIDNAGNVETPGASYTWTVATFVPYTVTYVSPLVGPPGVNSLYPTSIGTTATPVKWTLKNASGQAITAAGTVSGVSYKANAGCGTFPTDPTGATAASVTSSNPKYDTLQKLWVYNWVLPGRGCYTLFITLNTGQVIPLFYHIY